MPFVVCFCLFCQLKMQNLVEFKIELLELGTFSVKKGMRRRGNIPDLSAVFRFMFTHV